jgi:hypothetical protein
MADAWQTLGSIDEPKAVAPHHRLAREDSGIVMARRLETGPTSQTDEADMREGISAGTA